MQFNQKRRIAIPLDVYFTQPKYVPALFNINVFSEIFTNFLAHDFEYAYDLYTKTTWFFRRPLPRILTENQKREKN